MQRGGRCARMLLRRLLSIDPPVRLRRGRGLEVKARLRGQRSDWTTSCNGAVERSKAINVAPLYDDFTLRVGCSDLKCSQRQRLLLFQPAVLLGLSSQLAQRHVLARHVWVHHGR